MRQADIALIKAKKTQGNSIVYYQTDFMAEQEFKIYIETHLRKSIDEGGFELYFQPKELLRTGEVTSYEALLRWSINNKPISPVDFISIAEETGLILDITPWIIDQACMSAQILKERTGKIIRIAINISVIQLFHSSLANLLQHSINKYDLFPEQLEIEITETAVMENIDMAISELERIRKLGIVVSLDDFGTGHSSLSYLQRLPIDFIKIDQSFVINTIIPNHPDIQLVEAIINMAHQLGYQVIAEGVEFKEQKDLLKMLGCDYIQGFYLGKPEPLL